MENLSFVFDYGNFSNISMNFTEVELQEISYFWKDAVACVCATIMFLYNGFLLCVVNQDKKTYRKCYSLPLLNYLLNYTFFGLFYYFYNVHIHIHEKMSHSSCVFIHTMYTVFKDGTRCFILPICIDVIVQYFKPKLHEKQKFLTFQAIFLAVLWGILFTQTISIYSGTSEKDLNFCLLYIHVSLIWYQLGFALFFDCLLIICVILQLYIAAKREEPLMLTFNTLAAQTIIALFLTVLDVISISASIVMFVYIHSQLMNLYNLVDFIYMIASVLLPFFWLCDSSIRQSIWKKMTKGNAKQEDTKDDIELTPREKES
ncbi:uncharacterized protein LOC106869328 isoform X1 [Octopus bimaculoides]|uniref:G-protein coupled receptors family 1 profile domain-containing protein n=1 Tax=Octopus bimaculoides TaxID=37653 RepID=A0A0L8HPZ3_OCTBM|nr:uncharacterized protein LOC106869328 isoform X1 [Octopus bimaculoides]|eukprot:XP_014770519.1 PREDICTED: uncharacterized protein LOC106869328 isoform X1 [Octopus bimaculoides]